MISTFTTSDANNFLKIFQDNGCGTYDFERPIKITVCGLVEDNSKI